MCRRILLPSGATFMDDRIKTIEGDFSTRGLRFGIVASRFNDFIVDRLLDAAVATLTKHGVAPTDIEVVRVPGAYETPLAIKKLAASRRYQALIALGCVIRGATAHFDYVAGEASRGIGHVSLTNEIPVGFGILTVDTIEQAIERAGTKAGNKGVDAALAAIQMANVLRQLEQ
jgi:6,7-dimethyl-8-ribityllumazine synthase